MSSVLNDYLGKKQKFEAHIRLLRAALLHPDKPDRIAKETAHVKASCLRYLQAEIGKLPKGLTITANQDGTRLRDDITHVAALAEADIVAWFRDCRRQHLTATAVVRALSDLGDNGSTAASPPETIT